MPNSKAAEKHRRQSIARAARNQRTKSKLKTLAKKVDAAAKEGEPETVRARSEEFISALDKAACKGVIHKNKVARHKARCAKLLQS